jgi:hypothetical protein
MTLEERAQQIADMYEPPATGRLSDIRNADQVHKLLESLAAGNYLETAAHAAGLAPVTVYNWKKRGEAGEEPYATFVQAVKRAEADAEIEAIQRVRAAGKLPQFWAAEMTFLERRHPERWGRRTEVDFGPKVIVQVGVKDSDVTIQVQNSVQPSPALPPSDETST